MHFLHPEIFWLALALPLFGLLDWLWLIWQRRRSGGFMDAKFHETSLPRGSFWGLGFRLFLWFLGFAAILCALARPQGTPLPQRQETKRFLNSYIVLDGSLSMRARDAHPDRLGAAKAEIRALIDQLPGNRIGLIVFAGEAKVICPATFDYDALSNALERVQGGMPARPGSNLVAGLKLALEKLELKSGEGRAVVLLTDGEAHRGGALAELAQNALRRDIHIFTAGVGTLQGASIPMGRDLWGKEAHRMYRGKLVRTRLISLDLRKAARLGGGRYAALEVPGEAASAIAVDLERLARIMPAASQDVVRREYFQAAAGCAFLVLWLEPMLPRRRRRRG